MGAFVRSQFNYFPLVLMFHDGRTNAKLNKVCEVLRIACKNSRNIIVNSYFNRNKSLTINQRDLQLLMIEIFKRKNSFNPTFMKDVFAEKIAIIACEFKIISSCRK